MRESWTPTHESYLSVARYEAANQPLTSGLCKANHLARFFTRLQLLSLSVHTYISAREPIMLAGRFNSLSPSLLNALAMQTSGPRKCKCLEHTNSVGLPPVLSFRSGRILVHARSSATTTTTTTCSELTCVILASSTIVGFVSKIAKFNQRNQPLRWC